MLILACFTILLALAGAFRSPLGWVGFAIIFIILGGSAVISFLRRNWQISVYPEGLMVTKGKQVQTVRWQDIIAVDHLVRTISSNAGGYNTRSKQTDYQLRLRGGQVIMISNNFTDRNELIATIESRVREARASQNE